MRKIFLLFIIFLCSISSSAQWNLQNQLISQGLTLRNVKFISQSTGWIIGEKGKIFKTTDAGASWVNQSGSTNYDLYAISFTDPGSGTVVGDSGTILRTTDSGQTWVKQSSGTSGNLKGVFFTDAGTGFAAGDSGLILRTTNGGQAWTKIAGPVKSNLVGVFFTDAKTGFITADSSIIKTTDGGETWKVIKTQYRVNALSFSSPMNGLAAGSYSSHEPGNGPTYYYGVILKTTDGGETWDKQTNSNPNFNNFHAVSVIDANNAFAIGSGNFGYSQVFSRTTDGGTTWTTQTYSMYSEGRHISFIFNGISFSDPDNGTIVGGNGTIISTTNGGESWSYNSFGNTATMRSVALKDANNGIAVGSLGTITKTTDGGKSWTVIPVKTNSYLYNTTYADTKHCIAVGNETVLKSADGGITWKLLSFSSIFLRGVSFSDSSKGTAVGYKRIGDSFIAAILRTTDGGETWSEQPAGVTNTLLGIYMTDLNNATAVGEGGTIIKTTDAGATWKLQTSGTTVKLNSVYFTGVNKGIIVGEGGIILRTVDGGNTWVKQSSPVNSILYSVSFADENHGNAVGEGGIILKTINGGETWAFQQSKTSDILYGISLSDTSSGIIVGDVNTVLWTTNGGGTTSVDKNNGNSPESFSLKQNYPNPFNPTTKITYSLPEGRFVKLSVYDMLGKEISTLVNMEENAGTHTVQFNGSGLPSGVYIYTIKAGEFRDSKKLLLLK